MIVAVVIAIFRQLQIHPPPPPKKKTNKFRTSTGFELMASALGLQCSTIWAMKTHTLGAGQFVNGKWLLCPGGVKTWCSMSSMYPTIKNQPLHVGNGKEWKWRKKKKRSPWSSQPFALNTVIFVKQWLLCHNYYDIFLNVEV